MSFYSSILSKTTSLLSATNRGFMPRPSLFGGLQHNQLLSFWSILGNVRAKHSIKTNRSAYKRFRVKGNGQLKRNKAGTSHNTGHKGRKRVTRLSQSTGIVEPKIEKRMRMLIGA